MAGDPEQVREPVTARLAITGICRIAVSRLRPRLPSKVPSGGKESPQWHLRGETIATGNHPRAPHPGGHRGRGRDAVCCLPGPGHPPARSHARRSLISRFGGLPVHDTVHAFLPAERHANTSRSIRWIIPLSDLKPLV
jgi:hypothetical protein